MPKTRSRKIADLLSPASVAGTLSVDGGGGVATYTAIGDLPSSGLTAGDMAFVDSSDRLYIWAGSGWYNIALINRAPTIQSVLDSDGGSSPFALSLEGVATTITMLAQDSDGTLVTYSAVADSDFNAMATVSQLSNVFTITPTAIEGANTGTITFKASDGINLASEISTFTLSFITIIENSKYTSLLVQSAGVNIDGTNSTFTDASTNNLTVTAGNGTPVTNTFSPYRAGGYSVEFNGTGYITSTVSGGLGTGNFTLEWWDYLESVGSGIIFNSRTGGTGGDGIDVTTALNITKASEVLFGPVTTATNIWRHVALVRSGSTLTRYINGVVQGSVASTSDFNGSTFYIGGNPAGNSGYMLGHISNFRAVNGTAVYTAAFTPPTEPLTAIAGTTLLTCQNSYFVDNSVSAHAITVFGNTSVVPFGPYDYLSYDPAVNGGSVYFDGVGDYLTTATDAAFAFGTGDFTLECWFNVNQLGVSQKLITFYPVGSLSGYNAIFINTNNTVSYGRNGANNIASSETITTNVWYHLAAVRQSGTTKLYLNGVQVGSNFTDSTSYLTARPAIGTDGYSLNTNNLFGYMSDIRIVKGTAVYTSAFTPPTEPLTVISGTSLLINGDGASIIDASQSSALTLVGNTKSSTTQIKYGNSSMAFDGTGDYLKVLGTMPTLSADFTIEFWYYQNTTGQYDSLFTTVYAYATANSLRISTGPSNNTLNVASGPSAIFTSNTAFSNTTWLHIALVRSGSTMTLYQNGVSVGSATNTQSFISSDFTIGDTSGAGSPYYLDGYMQDLRVTNGLARYTTTFTPPAALLEG